MAGLQVGSVYSSWAVSGSRRETPQLGGVELGTRGQGLTTVEATSHSPYHLLQPP